jgi:tRNA (guanine-N7-)-methyltransferase
MSEKPLRTIRSYVRREGRITQSQQRALADLWPRYGIDNADTPLDLDALFGRAAPTVLEIGFGNGASLAQMAAAHPELDYLGIEVHRPGVGALLLLLEQHELSNVRVICADAVEVLKQRLPDASLDRVQLFFPDPWHKKRHHKRRILQPEFVTLVGRKLKPGGVFHLATDWEDYARQMLAVLSAAPGFGNLGGAEGYAPRPASRPLTRFEARGQRLGHGVWDLLFRKTAGAD